MCTSMTLSTADGRRLFGRTLDLDTHFGERVVLTSADREVVRSGRPLLHLRYDLLGMAAVEDGYPLYAEAMNRAGLCMAGLRFADNAYYPECPTEGKHPIAPWELIPYLLGRCATVDEARGALEGISLVNLPFSERIPAAPLHWHIADADASHGELVVESTEAGLRVYENPVGVLTNDPAFPIQMGRLPAAELPGDYTSAARFVRAATLRRAVATWMTQGQGQTAERAIDVSSVDQFFRILGAVAPMAGAVLTPQGGVHRTLYTCCMDGAAGIYRYFTEEDTTVRTVGFTQ